MLSLYHTIVSSVKAWIFKRRIKIFRKTKNDKIIIDKTFDTWGLTVLVFLAWICFILIWGVVVLSLALGVALLLYWFIGAPDKTGGIVTLICSAIGVAGVIYASRTNRKDKEKDRFDTSLYIIMCYLIELKRGNYNCKIYKDDLSCVFMNVPNDVLFVLRDVQDNIKNLKNKCDNIRFDKVIDKEILFLIIYIREFYHISDAELKDTAEHELILDNIIINSSSIKPRNATTNKNNGNKNIKNKS